MFCLLIAPSGAVWRQPRLFCCVSVVVVEDPWAIVQARPNVGRPNFCCVVLARSCAVGSPPLSSPDAPEMLAAAIRSTQAYDDVSVALSRDRNGFMQRGMAYNQLRLFLDQVPPSTVAGLPSLRLARANALSWRKALLVLQDAGWQVLLSTSNLDPSISSELQTSSADSRPRQHWPCLGAYRDLTLLLHSIPVVHRQLKALVLCNDSNLLVQPPEILVDQLEKWTSF